MSEINVDLLDIPILQFTHPLVENGKTRFCSNNIFPLMTLDVYSDTSSHIGASIICSIGR